MTMTAERKNIKEIIGISDGILYIAEDLFKYTEGFKGATGYGMRTITQKEIEYNREVDEVGEDLWRSIVTSGNTTDSLADWWQEQLDECEYTDDLYPFDDPSGRQETEELYDALSDEDRAKIEEVFGVKGEDYVTFTMQCAGRCFSPDMKWDVLLNPSAWELVKKAEL